MHFTWLHVVNFHRDALLRSQNAIIDSVNGKPPDSHHNLFIQFPFGKLSECFVMTKPSSRFLKRVHFFPHKSQFYQESDHSSLAETASNTPRNVEFWLSLSSCVTHSSIFFFFFTLPVFLRWTDIFENYQRHFS